MAVSNRFKKDNSQTSADTNDMDYAVPSFLPKKITMTKDLLQRKREDELRKKYGIKKEKRADIL